MLTHSFLYDKWDTREILPEIKRIVLMDLINIDISILDGLGDMCHPDMT